MTEENVVELKEVTHTHEELSNLPSIVEFIKGVEDETIIVDEIDESLPDFVLAYSELKKGFFDGFTYRGYFCLVKMINETGNICGYLKYNEDKDKEILDNEVWIHGGITFEDDDERVIGFDTAHLGDVMVSPLRFRKMANMPLFEGVGFYPSTFKTDHYVKKELVRMVDDLLDHKEGKIKVKPGEEFLIPLIEVVRDSEEKK